MGHEFLATEIPLVDVVSVIPLTDYRIALAFEDGKAGIFDMRPYLDAGVFRALKDPDVFCAVSVGYGTAVWPGEVDMAPERLYSECVQTRPACVPAA